MRNKRISLFDKVPFDRVGKKKLIEILIDWATKGKKKKAFNMNAYGVVTYLENEKYAKIMDSADIIYPDGWGPVFASRFFNKPLEERVNVGDFIGYLLERSDTKSLRIFLLGCKKRVVEKAKKIIKAKYKTLKTDVHDGFFSRRKEKEIISMINKFEPQIVLVGMGNPKQEIWIDKNWDLLPSAVYMGTGGVFHYIAGTKSRAPNWMRKSGLEWLYRLFQEPGRLWKRYTIYNLVFIRYLLKYILKHLLNSISVEVKKVF